MKNIVEYTKASSSKNELMRRLGLPSNGANIRKLNNLIIQYGLDISHFCRKAHNKKYEILDKVCPVCGNLFKEKIGCPKEKTVCSRACSNTLFRSGSNHGNFKNGKTMYRDNCFKYWEECCAIPGCEWNLTIEVHHIDRNRDNNNKENLIPLCPNHHRLTQFPEYKDEIDKVITLLIAEKFNLTSPRSGV